MKEHKIIHGCLQNDRKSQQYFVDNYSKYLFGVCIRYVKNEHTAKDCLQEALLQILKNFDKYEERGNFKAWIAKVTSMVCLQHIRKNKKFQYEAIEDAPEKYTSENVLQELEVNDVLKFLNTMPYNYRVAINMFIIEGYSHKEISKALDISESSSRSLVTRGRRMIVEAFQEKKTNKEVEWKVKSKISEKKHQQVGV